MKRILLFLLCMILLLNGCGNTETEVRLPDASLHAFVTSDLHLSDDPNVIASIVPAMPYSADIARTIAAQVIAAQPDVFIMTGDNTNSGGAQDMQVLKEILQKIRDAGIPVVMTTGNHDFSRSTPQEYWDCYGELFDILEKDPDSLSYITEIGNVRLFAMDDNSYDNGHTGTYTDSTMKWLRRNLQKAAADGKAVLFLSHHNVIIGPSGDAGNSYRITNSGLPDLLKQQNVLICFTGHQHGQVIQQEDSLREVISAMPLRSPHRIGEVKIEGRTLTYQTVPIDFAVYGDPLLAEKIRETDAREGNASMEAIGSILKEEGLSGEDYEGTMRLISRFFQDSAAGILSETAESIKNDAYYDRMIAALRDHNYGPWMEAALNDPPANAEYLVFSW